MTEADAIGVARAHAAKYGVSWVRITRTTKIRDWLFRVGGYEFLVDTGDGRAEVAIRTRWPPTIQFEYYPTNPSSFLLPPWAAFDRFTLVSIGWRMSPGERYWQRWHEWYAALDDEAKAEYRGRLPEPSDWRGGGFYRLLCINNL